MSQLPLLKVELPEGQLATLALNDLQENCKGASNHLRGSMRSTGQREPILVELLPDGSHFIRDGNRRVETAKKLMWQEIEAELFSGLTELEWALVIAARHNRSPNPVEEARLFQTLGASLTAEGIAANTGFPLQVIRARLTLLNLPDDVLALIGSKTLSLSVAERAARLQHSHLDKAVIAIRNAAAGEQSFTAKALKEITVARANQLGSKLLAAAPAAPTLIPPAEVLALEVRDLAARRGVNLSDLVQELQPSQTSSPSGGTAARLTLH